MIPLAFLRILADFAGTVFYLVEPRSRAVALANLEAVFGDEMSKSVGTPIATFVQARKTRSHVLYSSCKWKYIRTRLFIGAYPTLSPKNFSLPYLERDHTNLNSSSTLSMTTSDEGRLQTEARRCCDYAPTRNSNIWCLAV
jgi:hypothetical protein